MDFEKIDFANVEQRLVNLVCIGIERYIGVRSNVSSRHKLATFDELVHTDTLTFLIGTSFGARKFLREILDVLIREGRIIEYPGGYLSTEPKDVL